MDAQYCDTCEWESYCDRPEPAHEVRGTSARPMGCKAEASWLSSEIARLQRENLELKARLSRLDGALLQAQEDSAVLHAGHRVLRQSLGVLLSARPVRLQGEGARPALHAHRSGGLPGRVATGSAQRRPAR